MIDVDKSQTITTITAIVLNDVVYVLTLVWVCAMSFGVGLVIGILSS